MAMAAVADKGNAAHRRHWHGAPPIRFPHWRANVVPDRHYLAPLLAAFLAASTLPAAAADYPRTSVEGAVDGVPDPFVGKWAMRYPELEGTVVAAQLATCDRPVVIEKLGETRLAYTSQDDEHSEFELSAFGGRTVWSPDDAPSLLAVWTGADSFYVYTVGPMGSADWTAPFAFERCG